MQDYKCKHEDLLETPCGLWRGHTHLAKYFNEIINDEHYY